MNFCEEPEYKVGLQIPGVYPRGMQPEEGIEGF